MKKELPDIFEYTDFRKYLADYQTARYSFDKSFNKSKISKLLNLPNTRSYFTDVLKGRRVTSTFIERFINLLELNKKEARFFRALVNFNQADYTNERDFYYEELISMHKTSKRMLKAREYQYYRDWYNSIIRALLNTYDFDGNYKRLAKMVFPPITPNQAKESVELLKELNLVACNPDGILKPTDKSISAGSYKDDEVLKQYQLQCLEQVKQAVIKKPSDSFNVSTNVISVSGQGYKSLEKSLQKFKKEVRSIIQNDELPAEKVYQMDIIIMPNSV